MEIKEQWMKLASELGFQFSRKIRPFIELPSLHKMAANAVKKGVAARHRPWPPPRSLVVVG